MNPPATTPSLTKKVLLTAGIVIAILAVIYAFMSYRHMSHGGMNHDNMGNGQMNHGTMNQSYAPKQAGQDAFATIQEIVSILENDPKTDWSKVNINRLRTHLIDMNEVVLKAKATENPLPNGLEILIEGEGQTLKSIQNMVPAHAQELGKIKDWQVKTENVPTGVKLTLESLDEKIRTKFKALGFFGVMTLGAHHQPHHLMMAKGQMHH